MATIGHTLSPAFMTAVLITASNEDDGIGIVVREILAH